MSHQKQAKSAAAAAAPPEDMSVKLGGRVFRPALPVVDGSFPTETELGFDQTLQSFCRDHIPVEPREGIETRERVLNRMLAICREWIQSVGVRKGLPAESGAGGQLFTSGSYRLGVHEPGADIDTILVAPASCQRADFFGTNIAAAHAEDGNHAPQRDPDSLAMRIKRHPDVTNFVPVEGAAVPLLTFDWEGINIDLLFARLNTNTVPEDFDVDNDVVLDGADSATEKSLNGPRVTNLIAAFVSGGGNSKPHRYSNFLTVVRCVRKWAKARGLYSNKMGYWGGVNINIGVALTVQLYPNACPAQLLRKFFLVFSSWRWPQPVLLTKPHDAGYGLQVWSPAQSVRQVAPIITPAYPAMNSTLSVSRQTLQILQEEFNRAHNIVDQLWKAYQQDPTTAAAELNWKQLFEPSDFFIAYPSYLSLCIVGPSQAEAQAWAGFVESRLRKLVSDLLGRSMPMKKIQLWPKKKEACIADKSALLTQAQRQNCITYFIGFQVDKNRMRGDQLNLEIPLQHFRDWDLSRFPVLVPGMDVLIKHFKVKELPKICFEDMYEGGKEEAMAKRRQLRDADPVRQEKKRLARLSELKAKMEEIQRKKEAQKDKKRKREELDLEEEAGLEKAVKEEEMSADKAPEAAGEGEDEEADLLFNALETAQEPGEGMTREEAQAEKEKLLSGELIEEEADADGYESDENAVGYAKDEARQVVVKRKSIIENKWKDKRSLPVSDEVVEALRKIGYNVVGDEEATMLGANMIPPWRAKTKDVEQQRQQRPPIRSLKIKFTEKFDMVELDANGHVIDKGDDDFIPSKTWIGRKPAMEFKLGERGLGYYRTGAKVVVPSNTAY